MEARVGKKPHSKVKKHGEHHKKGSSGVLGKEKKHGHGKRKKSKKSKKGFACCAKKTKKSHKHKSKKPKTKQPTTARKPTQLAPAPAEDLGDIVLVKQDQPGQKLDGKSADFIPPELRRSPKLGAQAAPDGTPEQKKDVDPLKSTEKLEAEKSKDVPLKSNKSKEQIGKEDKDDKKENKDETKAQDNNEKEKEKGKEKDKEKEKEKEKEHDMRSDKEKDSDGPAMVRKSKKEAVPCENVEEKKEKWLQLSKQIIKEDANVPEKEFENVSCYIPPFVSKRHFVKNMDKNRFADVICMDHSRVPLSDGGYIHANYVQLENDKKVILTQLPLPHTACDFWQMVIERKVKCIALLLTDLEYEQFGGDFVFPQNQDFMMFSDQSIRVGEFRQIDIQRGWTMRVLSISNGDYKSYLHVHHFKTWPHNGVPKSLKSVWQLQSSLRKYNGPIVYMSLSGCGRAGTYALFEYAHSSLHGDSQVFNLGKCLEKVRNGRMHSVQNVTQYSFVYTLIAEHVLGNGFNKLAKTDEAVEEDMNKILKQLTIQQC